MRRIIHMAAMFSVLAASSLVGSTNIDPAHKFGWTENAGWTNWHDANNGNQGVDVGNTFLSGYIWAENVGWLNVGDGTPTNGTDYANVDGSDFGVNIDGSDDLYGLAWGENVGWVNFDTRVALGPYGQQARLDRASYRFRGYAWGENVGWINLDDAVHYVGLIHCVCGDTDGSGGPVDLGDFGVFALCYGLSGPDPNCDEQAFFCSDLDDSGLVDLSDFATFALLYGATWTSMVPNCP